MKNASSDFIRLPAIQLELTVAVLGRDVIWLGVRGA